VARPRKRQQDVSSPSQQLVAIINHASRATNYCVGGDLPGDLSPGLEVEGVGPIKLPLKPTAAKKLLARCQLAPYGKGTETLVDPGVRNTYELDPKHFQLKGVEWNRAIEQLVEEVAQKLGLPTDRLEARLYKLLLYKSGGFFLPHRDSEKADGMIASLVVVLPGEFGGGGLTVRHGAFETSYSFRAANHLRAKAPSYAAFYADCEHEVEQVTSGHRLCLTYNLVMTPQAERTAKGATPGQSADVDRVAESIATWVAKDPRRPLVFAFDHHYTQKGLSLDLLKGGDRQLAELVVPAAQKVGCEVHLAQVERHLVQFADDGDYGWGYRSRGNSSKSRKIEIGETYEDTLDGAEWVNLEGEVQPWGTIPLQTTSILSWQPIDQWQPTTEEYEGFTGNEGNTLDRWYHRSALVVWSRERRYWFLAKAGQEASFPLFSKMISALPRVAKGRREEARSDTIQLARGIIAEWPSNHYWAGDRAQETPGAHIKFTEQLLKLRDRDTIAAFLSQVAMRDQWLDLSSLIKQACLEFGWDAFSAELAQLVRGGVREEEANRSAHLLLPRDAAWLFVLASEAGSDSARELLTRKLLTTTIQDLCQPSDPSETGGLRRRFGARSTPDQATLSLLLKSLVAVGDKDGQSQVTRFLQQNPKDFPLADCQVPVLESLIPWSNERDGSVSPPLRDWLASTHDHLKAEVARKPVPPVDWVRSYPSKFTCSCQYCRQVRAFLDDPEAETISIKANEQSRQHVSLSMRNLGVDVKEDLDRSSRPYALVLTKTRASYDRLVKTHELNQDLMKRVAGLK